MPCKPANHSHLPTAVWRLRCSVYFYIANGLEQISTEESLLAVSCLICASCQAPEILAISDRQCPCTMLRNMKVLAGM